MTKTKIMIGFFIMITLVGAGEAFTAKNLYQYAKLFKYKKDAANLLIKDKQQSTTGSYFFFEDGRIFKLLSRGVNTKFNKTTPYAIITIPGDTKKIRITLPCSHFILINNKGN